MSATCRLCCDSFIFSLVLSKFFFTDSNYVASGYNGATYGGSAFYGGGASYGGRGLYGAGLSSVLGRKKRALTGTHVGGSYGVPQHPGAVYQSQYYFPHQPQPQYHQQPHYFPQPFHPPRLQYPPFTQCRKPSYSLPVQPFRINSYRYVDNVYVSKLRPYASTSYQTGAGNYGRAK